LSTVIGVQIWTNMPPHRHHRVSINEKITREIPSPDGRYTVALSMQTNGASEANTVRIYLYPSGTFGREDKEMIFTDLDGSTAQHVVWKGPRLLNMYYRRGRNTTMCTRYRDVTIRYIPVQPYTWGQWK
jgi:hypothetical protein